MTPGPLLDSHEYSGEACEVALSLHLGCFLTAPFKAALTMIGRKMKSRFGPKRRRKKNLGNETFSQNPYFISLKGFVEAGLRGRRRHM